MVSDHAVVSDVGVGHDESMAPHFGEPAAFDSAAADGYTLANFVVVADLQPRRLASVGNILGRHSDGAEGKEGIIGTDFRGPFDSDVRHQTAALSQFDIGPDHAIGADLARCWDLGSRINDCSGMDRGGMDVHD